jgi:PAS domain S-box-containing protein
MNEEWGLEANYHALVENINDVIFSLNTQGRFTYVSPAIERFAHYQTSEVIGQPFDCFVHPDDLGGLQTSFERTLTGDLEPYEFRVFARDGAVLHVRTSSRPLWENDQLVGLTGVMTNITERVRAEQALRQAHAELEQRVQERTAELVQANRMLNILSACNQVVVRATEEPALLQEVCRIIVDLGGYPLVWVGFAEQDAAQTVRPAAQAGLEEGYLDIVNMTWADTERGRGPTGAAIRSGQPCITKDIQTDPHFAPWREDAIRRGYASSIALPLRGDERVFGALNIYAAKPDAFHTAEVDLLMELANDLAFGVTSLRERAERKRAEEAARESEMRYRAIVEAFDGLIYICSPDYRVEFMNKQLLERTGYDGTGELCYKVLHDRDSICPWCVNNQVFAGETVRWEVQSPKDNHWYYVVNTPIYHTDGSISKQAMILDITERKQAEEALKEQYSTLRSIIESNNAPIFSIDRQYRYTSFNTAHAVVMKAIYGVEIETGHSLLDYMTVPEDREVAKRNLDRALAGEPSVEEAYSGEERRSRRYFQVSHNPIRTEEGAVIGVAVFALDITGRKQAQEALTLFRSLIDHTSEAIEIIDPETGRFLDANEQACLALGYTREEFLTLTVPEINPVVAARSWKETLAELRRSGSLIRESQRRHKDGSIFPVEINVNYIRLDRDYVLAVVRDITERKRAERELQRSNELLRAIIEAAPTAIIGLDLDGNVQMVWNPAAEKMLGWSAQEVMGRFLPSVLVESQEEFRRFREMIRSGKTLDGVEVRRQRRDGSSIDYSIYASPLRDAEGQITGDIAVLVDITERKRAEGDLRKLSHAIEHSPASIVITDSAGNIEYVNPKFTQITGYTRDEVIGKNPRILKSGETPPEEYTRLWDTITHGGVWRGEFHNKKENGELYWESASISPIIDSQGNITHFVAVKEDITERKRAEEALRQSEERYRTLYQDNPSTYFTVDAQGAVLSVNPFGAEQLGYTVEELIGQSMFKVFYPDDLEAVQQQLRACLQHPGQVVHWEFRKVRRDGSILWVREAARAVQEAEDKPVVFIVCEDITERKRAEEALSHYVERLKTLRQIDQAILSAQSAEAIARAALGRIRHLLPCQWASVAEFDLPTATASVLAVQIDDETRMGMGACIALTQWEAMAELEQGRIRVVEDILSLSQPSQTERVLGAEGLRSTLNVPLVAQGELIGALNLGASSPGAFSLEHVDIAREVADQLAVGIQNARLYRETRLRAERLAAVNRIGRAVSATLHLDDLMEVVYQGIVSAFEADALFVALYDPLANELDYRIQVDQGIRLPPERQLLEAGLTAWIVTQKKPLLIRNYEQEREGLPVIHLWGTMQVPICWLGAPMQIGERVVGVISVQAYRPYAYGEEEQLLLSTIADQVAVAVENARLFEAEQRRRQEAETLRQAALALTTSLDRNQVVERILGQLQRVVPYDSASVQLLKDGQLEIIGGRGFPNLPDILGFIFSTEGENPNSVVVRTRAPFIVSDGPAVYKEFQREPHASAGIRAWLGVPMLVGEQLIGIITLDKREPGFYTPEQARLAEAFAAQAAAAIENSRLYEQVRLHVEELADALARLRELDRLKSEFIQNVSHELRTPLALARGYAELLLAGDFGELPPQQREAVEIITRRTQMLGALVEDMTFILEAEARPPVRETVALDELTRDVLEDFQAAASRAGLTLRAEVASDLTPVSGESVYLRRVLDNLLSNALKFTPAGGSITVRAWQAAGHVLLQVADTGIGIPAEQQGRIFERFYQVDGSARRRYGGVGLGLALVKETVEALGGKVSVESVVGHGSTFTITLPASDA